MLTKWHVVSYLIIASSKQVPDMRGESVSTIPDLIARLRQKKQVLGFSSYRDT